MRKLFKVAFVFCVFLTFGQEHPKKHVLNIDAWLPTAVRSAPFAKYMQGVVNTGLMYNYVPKKTYSYGLGLRYERFNVDKVKLMNTVNGSLDLWSVYGGVDVYRFVSEQCVLSLGLRTGISFGGFQMDYKDTNLVGDFPISPVVRFEPCFGVMLYADEFVAYRWVLSYTAVNQLYKSSYLGMTEFEGFSSAQSRKQIGWLNVGFTVVYYLHKPSEESQGEF